MSTNGRTRVALFLGFDFRIKGGLISMVRAMRSALLELEADVTCFMPTLVGNRLFWGPRDLEDEGIVWHAVGGLPRAPNFVGPWLATAQLARHLQEFDIVQSVVGGGGWSLPGVRGVRSVTWVATPYEEDWRPRVRLNGGWKRAAFEGLVRCENVVEGFALRRQDRVLALSSKTREVLVDRHRLDEGRVGQLYAPIDETVFSPGDEPDGARCVMTGRLDDERKDVPTLVRAWEHVASKRPDAQLILIGPYAEQGPVAQAVAASPARDAIELVGPLEAPEVAERLRSARLFVLPSRQEGLGIVALEAMACGAPVVTFSNGGTDELVERSSGGEVVRSRSPQAFAQAVLRLLDDVGRWRAARGGALELVWQEATRAAFRDGVRRAYAEVRVPFR